MQTMLYKVFLTKINYLYLIFREWLLKLLYGGYYGTLINESSEIDRVKSERIRSLFFTALINAAEVRTHLRGE